MSQSLPWSPETTFDTDSNVPTEYADESSGCISLQFGNSDIMEFNSINEFIELDHRNVNNEQDLAVVSPLPPQTVQKVNRVADWICTSLAQCSIEEYKISIKSFLLKSLILETHSVVTKSSNFDLKFLWSKGKSFNFQNYLPYFRE